MTATRVDMPSAWVALVAPDGTADLGEVAHVLRPVVIGYVRRGFTLAERMGIVDPEDVAAEAFARVVKPWPFMRFANAEGLMRYLFVVSKRVAIDTLRRHDVIAWQSLDRLREDADWRDPWAPDNVEREAVGALIRAAIDNAAAPYGRWGRAVVDVADGTRTLDQVRASDTLMATKSAMWRARKHMRVALEEWR